MKLEGILQTKIQWTIAEVGTKKFHINANSTFQQQMTHWWPYCPQSPVFPLCRSTLHFLAFLYEKAVVFFLTAVHWHLPSEQCQWAWEIRISKSPFYAQGGLTSWPGGISGCANFKPSDVPTLNLPPSCRW